MKKTVERKRVRCISAVVLGRARTRSPPRRGEDVLRTFDRAREAYLTAGRSEAQRLLNDASAAFEELRRRLDRDQPRWAATPVPNRKPSPNVTIHVEDAAIRQVLMTIGRHAPVGMTWPLDLFGRVTIHLEDVPWHVALDQALAVVGWKAVEDRPAGEGKMGSFRLVPLTEPQTGTTTLESLHAEIRALRREVQEIKRILLER